MNTNKKANRLKNNIISSSAYQVLVMIVPIITTPYVTRIFDVNQMGEYSLSITLASLFVVIAQFGLPTYGAREIAISDSKKEATESFFKLESMQILTSIVSFILYNVIFIFLIDSANKPLYFVQSFLILANIFDISWYYIGIEEIGKVIVRNAMSKFFTTIAIFIFVNKNDQLILYALINILGILLGNLSMLVQSFRYINYSQAKFLIKFENMKSSFKLLVPTLVNTSYNSAEKSILNIITTSVEVGIYNEAKKIINLIAAAINSAFSALSPRMSYFVSKGEKEKVNLYFLNALKFCEIFSIIVVSGTLLVSEDFVAFFYGPGYEMVAPVLMVSSVSLITMPVTVLITRGILIPYAKDKEYSNSIVIILITGIVSNLLLDGFLGAIGAAISFTITQIFSYIYVVITIKEIVEIKMIITQNFKVLLLIVVNVLIVSVIIPTIYIGNPFISFLIKGSISVLLNVLIIYLGSKVKQSIQYT